MRPRSHLARVCAWLVLLTATSHAAAQAAGDDAGVNTPTSRGADGEGQGALSAPALPLGEMLTGQAKRDYETALLLHKSGDFEGARRQFSSAYDATQDVRLLWNAAVCEQSLRHYAKAIALVRRYLSSRSPLITEQAERDARSFLEAALPLTARLLVHADEPGGSAELDGEPLGTLPLDAETRVDFGTHRLAVKKTGFRDATQTFVVTSSADVKLALRLEPIVHEGRLVVRAGRGDVITIDGRFRALGTFDGTLASGSRRLRVTGNDSQPFETSVLIEDDRTHALDVTLSRTPASFSLPPWAWIVGGAAVLAGAGAATFFVARSWGRDEGRRNSPRQVQLPLRVTP